LDHFSLLLNSIASLHNNSDGETDSLIQQMLRTKFSETTLITIAHRLNTIIDFDTVVVMEAGRAVEIGSPKELLDLNGVFAELVDATGPKGSRALRALAR
jgi:ABC-type multidrug transport system fused ATPase/permease subunit